MQWGKATIDNVAIQSAKADFDAFERIGLEAMADARVLDMGCFDGFNTVLKFAPYDNIEEVVGIDIEDEALVEARQRTNDGRFSWAHADAETYDGPDESFDLVYLSHVFQHTKDKQEAANNAFRLLRPGGYVVIKTFDDSCKISYPDPDRVMRRLFELYETEILPHTTHTRYTDRNNGQKCPFYLRTAGFEEINISITTTDSLNKTLEQRRVLYERFTYFRRNIPVQMPPQKANEYRELLAKWKEMFEDEYYYHASNTFVITARKPLVPAGEEAEEIGNPKLVKIRGEFTIEPMTEQLLGQVMAIEVNAFPDPWTPVAYAMELRHNPNAHYVVALDKNNSVAGYVGWWTTDQGMATIMHIAVDGKRRKQGIGSILIDYACEHAAKYGNCALMQLQVRSSNASARSFYKRNGFTEEGVSENYYTAPDDDAVIMRKPIK